MILIPEDLYHLEVVGVREQRSKVSGRTFKMLSLRVAEGPYTGNLLYRPIVGDFERARFVWSNVWDSIEDGDSLIGTHVLTRVAQEQYAGLDWRNRIEVLYPLPKDLIA